MPVRNPFTFKGKDILTQFNNPGHIKVNYQ